MVINLMGNFFQRPNSGWGELGGELKLHDVFTGVYFIPLHHRKNRRQNQASQQRAALARLVEETDDLSH